MPVAYVTMRQFRNPNSCLIHFVSKIIKISKHSVIIEVLFGNTERRHLNSRKYKRVSDSRVGVKILELTGDARFCVSGLTRFDGRRLYVYKALYDGLKTLCSSFRAGPRHVVVFFQLETSRPVCCVD